MKRGHESDAGVKIAQKCESDPWTMFACARVHSDRSAPNMSITIGNASKAFIES